MNININTKAYIEKFLKIKTKDGEIESFCLNKPQMKLYNAIGGQYKQGKPQRAIVLKARQMGFSTLVEGIIFKKTATAKNVKSGIVAHVDTATTNLFNMSKRYYNKLPEPLKPKLKASNAKEIIFDDNNGKGLGSSIKCMTAGGNGIGRSDTFAYLHISEYAFWKCDKSATLTGLLQAVPNTVNTMIVIESTANGYDDFKKLWDMAENGENDFVPVFVGWHEMKEYRMPYNGFVLTDEEQRVKDIYNLDNEQVAWRRWYIKNNCNGDINMFHQEYPSSPAEAFISTGDCAFDKEIVAARLEVVPKAIKCGYFDYDYDGLSISNIRFFENKNGPIKIYEDTKPYYPYVIGGDTSGDGSDYFTAQVLDNTTGQQVAVLKHQYDDDLYARQIYCLGEYYNRALIGIESNYTTYPIKEIQRLGYNNQYWRETNDEATKKVLRSYGFKTTLATRPVIIAELVKIVRDSSDIFNDRSTLMEMMTFIKNNGRPEAQAGEHDDLIMALAIAYAIRHQQSYIVDIVADGCEDNDDYSDFLEYGG